MNNAASTELTVGTKVAHAGDYSNLPKTGEVVAVFDTGWVTVKWENGVTNMQPAALFTHGARARIVEMPSKADLDVAIAAYIARLSNHRIDYKGVLTAETCRRYVRIVNTDSSGSRFALAFIDRNGDIYKPHGWKGQAKGVRGNIFRLREVAS